MFLANLRASRTNFYSSFTVISHVYAWIEVLLTKKIEPEILKLNKHLNFRPKPFHQPMSTPFTCICLHFMEYLWLFISHTPPNCIIRRPLLKFCVRPANPRHLLLPKVIISYWFRDNAVLVHCMIVMLNSVSISCWDGWFELRTETFFFFFKTVKFISLTKRCQ